MPPRRRALHHHPARTRPALSASPLRPAIRVTLARVSSDDRSAAGLLSALPSPAGGQCCYHLPVRCTHQPLRRHASWHAASHVSPQPTPTLLLLIARRCRAAQRLLRPAAASTRLSASSSCPRTLPHPLACPAAVPAPRCVVRREASGRALHGQGSGAPLEVERRHRLHRLREPLLPARGCVRIMALHAGLRPRQPTWQKQTRSRVQQERSSSLSLTHSTPSCSAGSHCLLALNAARCLTSGSSRACCCSPIHACPCPPHPRPQPFPFPELRLSPFGLSGGARAGPSPNTRATEALHQRNRARHRAGGLQPVSSSYSGHTLWHLHACASQSTVTPAPHDDASASSPHVLRSAGAGTSTGGVGSEELEQEESALESPGETLRPPPPAKSHGQPPRLAACGERSEALPSQCAAFPTHTH